MPLALNRQPRYCLPCSTILRKQPALTGSGEMCSPQPQLHWVGAPPLQQPRKDSWEGEWNTEPGALTPFSPKIKSWTVTSYFLLHPPELFFAVKKSKMGNVWNYNCFPYTAAHGSLEKSYRAKLRDTCVHGAYPWGMVNRTDVFGTSKTLANTSPEWMNSECVCDFKKITLPSVTSSKWS